MIDYATFQRIQHLHRVEQLTVAQIALAIALDARTVRRWLDEPRFRPRLSCARPSKLDPYKAYIRRLLEHHPYSAAQILIKARAREHGLTVSRFLVRCALHEGPPAPEPLRREGAERPEGPALALTQAEQRELHEMAERLERCAQAVLGPRPDGGLSVLEALDFVAGWLRTLDTERRRLASLATDAVDPWRNAPSGGGARSRTCIRCAD